MLKHVTIWCGPSPRCCASATQPCTKKYHSGADPVSMCPLLSGQSLNPRPTTGFIDEHFNVGPISLLMKYI